MISKEVTQAKIREQDELRDKLKAHIRAKKATQQFISKHLEISPLSLRSFIGAKRALYWVSVEKITEYLKQEGSW